MIGYFAYGANMDRAHMAATTPDAVPLGVATLPNHRIAIGRSGYGTLIEAPGHLVRGFLWSLTPSDVAALDRFEGVPEGHYRQAHRQVVDASSTTVVAMVYLATDARPGVAQPAYLAQILRAARALGFPNEYLSEVSDLPVTESRHDGDSWVGPSERPNQPLP